MVVKGKHGGKGIGMDTRALSSPDQVSTLKFARIDLTNLYTMLLHAMQLVPFERSSLCGSLSERGLVIEQLFNQKFKSQRQTFHCIETFTATL